MPDRFHSKTLRTGRYSSKGQIYLVTAITLHRTPVFRDWALGRLLVMEMKQAQDLGLAHSLAWVVMPDHAHWLFELRTATLTQLMRRVKSRSAIAVNKASGRQGRLWQDGFHDRALRREDEIVRSARYIIANPLRAGLVDSIGQYPLWDAIWV